MRPRPGSDRAGSRGRTSRGDSLGRVLGGSRYPTLCRLDVEVPGDRIRAVRPARMTGIGARRGRAPAGAGPLHRRHSAAVQRSLYRAKIGTARLAIHQRLGEPGRDDSSAQHVYPPAPLRLVEPGVSVLVAVQCGVRHRACKTQVLGELQPPGEQETLQRPHVAPAVLAGAHAAKLVGPAQTGRSRK